MTYLIGAVPGLTRLGLVGGGTNSEESAAVASVATPEVSATTGSDATAATSGVSAVRPSVSASGTSANVVTSPATSEHLIREDLLFQLRNHFAQKVTMVDLDERPLPLRDQFP